MKEPQRTLGGQFGNGCQSTRGGSSHSAKTISVTPGVDLRPPGCVEPTRIHWTVNSIKQTRHGNDTQYVSLQLELRTPKVVYFPGSLIQGNLAI